MDDLINQINDIEAALAPGGGGAHLHIRLGRLCLEAGRSERALEAMSAAIALSGPQARTEEDRRNLSGWLVEYAAALESAGRDGEALQAFRSALEWWPENAYAHDRIVALCLKGKDYRGAAEACEKLIALTEGDDNDENLRSRYLKLSYIYSELKEYDRALVAAEKAVARWPESGLEEQLHKGRLYFGIGAYDRALKEFRAALAPASNRSREDQLGVYREIGFACAALKDTPGMIESGLEIIKRDPGAVGAHITVGECYWDSREHDAAVEHLEQALAIAEKAPLSGGDANVRAAELRQNLARKYREIALMRCREGDAAASRDAAARALRHDLTGEVIGGIGRLYVDLGDMDKAAALLASELLAGRAAAGGSPLSYSEAVKVYNTLIRISDDLVVRQRYKDAAAFCEGMTKVILGGANAGADGTLSLVNDLRLRASFCRREETLAARPRSLLVSLTGRCNLRCVMCQDLDNLGWELPEHTIREIGELLPYLREVQWRGGEAFLSKHFRELFDRACSCPGLAQTINTNGLLLTEEWAEKFVGNNTHIIFSIDGVTPGTYESIRRGGKFERLLQSLEYVKNARRRAAAAGDTPKMKTSMTFVVMRNNYREIDLLAEFAHRYGIDEVRVSRVVRQPGCGEPDDYADGVLDRVIEAMGRAYLRCHELGIAFLDWFFSDPPYLEDKAAPEPEHPAAPAAPQPLPAAAALPKQCMAPWQWLFINTGGDVFFHCFCSVPIGKVSETALMDMWNGQVARDYRKARGCAEHRAVCRPQELSRCDELLQ